jgi:hypothetical protein
MSSFKIMIEKEILAKLTYFSKSVDWFCIKSISNIKISTAPTKTYNAICKFKNNSYILLYL